MIFKAMDLRRLSYAVVFVILLCALAIGGSEGRRKTHKYFSSNEHNRISPEMDENTEEMIWIHCRETMIDGKSAVESLDLYSPQRAISKLKSLFLTKRDLNNEILVLPIHVKQKFIDCLKERSNQFHAPKSKLSSLLFIKHVKQFSIWQNPPERYLISVSPEQVSDGTPFFDSWLPIKDTENPLTVVNKIESQSPPSSRKHSPPAKSSPSCESSSLKSSPLSKKSQSSKKSQPKKHEDYHIKTNAIVAASSIVFCITALIICCCMKRRSRKIAPREGRDDGPLLNLTAGKPNNVGINSGNFAGNIATSSENYDSSHTGATPSEDIGSAPFPPLKPPPGRSVAPPPESPPPEPPPAPKPPQPPPPPKVVRPPPAPPKPGKIKPMLSRPGHRSSDSGIGSDVDSESGCSKAKLKPFFWDKVSANPEQSMVWHEISAGSFQFNEKMIETLFGYNSDNNKNDRKKGSPALEPAIQYIRIIDPKKAQNLSILLRALDVTTEEVADALREGNELPIDLLQTLLKMAPTTEEELKLRLYTGDLSQLGPAERFLKALVDIPFSFKRLESLLFLCSYQEEVTNIKESFVILEVACNKLRKSRLFLKLLEAVLKTGNRMNDGTYRGSAQAFKLDTLLKLADVKGTDGKTTLLHFVVEEIIRSEGVKALRIAKASQSMSSIQMDDSTEDIPEESILEQYHNLGLQVVLGLSDELVDIKKAAAIDSDGLTANISRLNSSLNKTKDFLNVEMKNLDEESEFVSTLASFVEHAKDETANLVEEDKRIVALVKDTADYFHGNAGKEEGLRLFAIVSDFLRILEKVCREIKESETHKWRTTYCKKESATEKEAPTGKEVQTEKEAPTGSEPSENLQPHSDIRQLLFPAIAERRMEDSSDEESP